MLEFIQNATNLSANHLTIIVSAVLLAGLVRGFAGFALSAIVMASLAVLIPPVELIPVCFILEAAASLAMFRGGMRDADMSIVWGLAITSAIGVPLGLLATVTIEPGLSKKIALILILVLAIAQLARLNPNFLSTKPGLYASGLTAGIATGLASVGGMVVALYVLASGIEAKRMRASLVMFLFIGMFTSVIYLFAYGLMNEVAFWRGLLLTPIVLAGVFIGSLFFKPEQERLYKTLCRLLLIALCSAGLVSQFG